MRMDISHLALKVNNHRVVWLLEAQATFAEQLSASSGQSSGRDQRCLCTREGRGRISHPLCRASRSQFRSRPRPELSSMRGAIEILWGLIGSSIASIEASVDQKDNQWEEEQTTSSWFFLGARPLVERICVGQKSTSPRPMAQKGNFGMCMGTRVWSGLECFRAGAYTFDPW